MTFEFHFPMPSKNGWHQGTRIFINHDIKIVLVKNGTNALFTTAYWDSTNEMDVICLFFDVIRNVACFAVNLNSQLTVYRVLQSRVTSPASTQAKRNKIKYNFKKRYILLFNLWTSFTQIIPLGVKYLNSFIIHKDDSFWEAIK